MHIIASSLTFLLPSPLSQTCLTSMGAQVVFNRSILPGQADILQEGPQDWLVRLDVDLNTLCHMWMSKQSQSVPLDHYVFF